MNLTLTIVHNTKKTNKLYYTGDDLYNVRVAPPYATPKVTKYQRCNFIIQVHQFTIKIDKININLLFECVKIVEFNFNSGVFYLMYQETRFLNQDA